MSYYLIDLNKDIEDFDYNKIVIGDEIKMDNNTGRKYLYYLDDKPKEIYIKMPFIRLIYNYQNTKYNQIKLPIYPLWEKTNKFIIFMKRLEKYIKLKTKSSSKYSSYFTEYNNLKSLKININDIKIKSVLSDIDIKDFKTGGEVEFIIKLSHIFDFNSKFGLNINGYQVKYIPSIDQLNIDFWEDDEIKVPKYDIILKSRIASEITNNINNNINNNIIDIPKTKIPQQLSLIKPMINMTDLINMKNKLKKID